MSRQSSIAYHHLTYHEAKSLLFSLLYSGDPARADGAHGELRRLFPYTHRCRTCTKFVRLCTDSECDLPPHWLHYERAEHKPEPVPADTVANDEPRTWIDPDPYALRADPTPTGKGDPLAEVYGAFDRLMKDIDTLLA